MPLQETSGNVTTDAYGGGVAYVPTYIEDVFSTYLYTGTGATQSITNGIDLSSKGGLVWCKPRDAANNHLLADTSRGTGKYLVSNLTNANTTDAQSFTAFNTNGFSLGTSNPNASGLNYVSWTFRKQPKFFDVVTYTGNGTNNTAISHNLGSVPGFIIVKQTDAVNSWACLHRGDGTTSYSIVLNSTGAGLTPPNASAWGNGTSYVAPTSTQFTVGSSAATNLSGGTYVAYLFAHNAGGFGLTGTDNVISCGSVTSDGSGSASVNLGYEPQWVLLKNVSSSQYWYVVDNMRGLFAKVQNGNALFPNSTSGETAGLGTSPWINSTGMEWNGSYNPLVASSTYIYIAIRRGPMKVPTDATKVFSPNITSATTGTPITTNFPIDLQFWGVRDGNGYNFLASDRLRGVVTTPVSATSPNIQTSSTAAEITIFNSTRNWNNTGYEIGSSLSGTNAIYWNFKRAPSFFDEVCYTGTGSITTFNHNLGVVPELMILKPRSITGVWRVYSPTIGAANILQLNSNAASGLSSSTWDSTNPTATVFTVGANTNVNGSGSTYVNYLFATCAGVSKVGSYTGNGTIQTIDCGLTAGARFVLIKRTDSTGDWYVYDTARGMTTLTDPYLLLDSTAAEVATLGSVTTVSTGFAVNAAILAAINTNAASYIFLAIA